MTAITGLGLQESRAALDALPVGVVVYDRDRRLSLANAVIRSAYRDGAGFEDHARIAAHRGLFGPGDPEAQVAELMALDFTKAHRFRRRLPDGRVFDAHYTPLPTGHTLVCTIDISDGTAAQEHAERAAARLEAVLAGLRIGVAVFTPERSLALVNPGFTAILGLAAVDLPPGLAFESVLHEIGARIDDAGAGGFVAGQAALDRSRPSAIRLSRRNGLVVDMASDPLPDGGWTLTVADITPLSRAEDEALRRAGVLASIVNHIPHGVSVFGPDHVLRLVNTAYATIMEGAPVAVGDTTEQIIARRIASGEYGEGDPDALRRTQHSFVEGVTSARRRRRPNGRTIDIRSAPLPDGGHVSVVTDMTAVVEAEAESARRAEEMRAMLAHIRHGIVLWDAEGRVVASNPVAAELVGAARDHFAPGRTLHDVVADALARGNLGEGRLAETRAMWLREQDRGHKHLDQRTTRDGRILEVRSDPGPHGGFVTTYTDVTQVRGAEDALRLAKSAAEAANAAKSRFLATMSTELRSPVAAIQAELARLQRAPGAAPGASEACARASRAARRLLEMIDSVLDVARLEAGRVDLVDTIVEIPDVVRACLRKSDAAAAAAEVALVADLPEGLPPVRCDAARLHQALGHVLANAVRFAPPLDRVTIAARHDAATGDLLLTVQDNGRGIPEALLERVFEPFTQAGDGVRAGMGLYISRTMMRAHGGDLVLHRQIGGGILAELRLPSARVLNPGPETETRP